MGLREKLAELREEGLQDIKQSEDLKRINEIRVKMLGKKGPITSVLRGMRDLSAEERPKVGQFANKVRDELSPRNTIISSERPRIRSRRTWLRPHGQLRPNTRVKSRVR